LDPSVRWEKVTALVEGGLTANVAAELVTLPPALVITTSYKASSAMVTLEIVNEEEVAPKTVTPFLRHW
jgi:hypothetical protein